MDEMTYQELDAERRAALLQQELDAVYASGSYRLGRAVTWLPRQLVRGLRYVAANGLGGAVRYAITYLRYHKTGGKDYAYWACLKPEQYRTALERWYKDNMYTHETLNLDHPVLFSEKSQWIKLYGGLADRGPLVDKYAVRAWVKEKIGEEYLIPLLGVYDSFDEIDFDALPNKFAIKTNHGAGWNVMVQDKATFDRAQAKKQIDTWMKLNYTYYIGGLELQYEHIKPKILVEQFVENAGGDLYDYKIFCSDGEPQCILYITDRYTDDEERMRFYDTDWNLLPFNINVPLEAPNPDPRPANLEKMLELARVLSQGFPSVRVDLYSLLDNSIKFGEMTFITESGISRWHPDSANQWMGERIHLPGVDD